MNHHLTSQRTVSKSLYLKITSVKCFLYLAELILIILEILGELCNDHASFDLLKKNKELMFLC